MPSRRRSLLLAVLPLLLVRSEARGQQPSSAASISGSVVDSVTSRGIPRALVSVRGGANALTDSLGRFELSGVSPGRQKIVVAALGYAAAELDLTAPQTGARFRLVPTPLVLQGLDVSARRRDPGLVVGVVSDGSTGVPILGASASFPYSGTRAGALTDGQGVFRVAKSPPGQQLLLVRGLGYHDQLVPVMVDPALGVVEIRLDPDPLLLEGITTVHDRFRSTRNAVGSMSVWAFERGHLVQSPWRDPKDVLQNGGGVIFEKCPSDSSDTCVQFRGHATSTKVCIDDVPAIGGIDQLRTYQTSDFYLLEVYGGGRQIRAYTVDFVKKLSARPRLLLGCGLLL